MGLVDFYATIAIVLVIVVFFFALKIKAEKVTKTITGEELGLDATQIALLYAQTPIETSQGTMTFAAFIGLAAADALLEKELQEKTKEFFTVYADVLSYQLGWKIIAIQSESESTLVSSSNYNVISAAKAAFSAPQIILLPLPTPGDFIRIEIITVTTSAESIVESYTYSDK